MTRPHHSSDEYGDVPETLRTLWSLEPSSREYSDLRDQVITRCLPLAEHIAQRFRGRGEPQEDLVQIARVGLVNAIDGFDADKGDKFVSYAVPTIMGEVRRYFRDVGWAVHVPRRAKELNLMIARGSEQLAQTLGRSPTTTEIARHLDITIEDVSAGLIAAGAYKPDSMDTAVSRDDEGLSLNEKLGEEDPEIENAEGYIAVKPHLDALPTRDRQVLVLRFFGGMTQTQIAERVGLSQMHISRILSRTLGDLRSKLAE